MKINDVTIQPKGYILSDHRPITFKWKYQTLKIGKKKITYRQTKGIDIDKFKADILGSSLIKAPPTTLKPLVGDYNSTLSVLYDKHAPLKTKFIVAREDNPWFNSDIHNA